MCTISKRVTPKPNVQLHTLGTETGRIYNLVGWHRLDGLSILGVLRLFCVDFFILIYSTAVYLFVQNTFISHLEEEKAKEVLAKENEAKQVERAVRRDRRATEGGLSLFSIGVSPLLARNAEKAEKRRARKAKAMEVAKYLSEVLFILFLMGAAILHPSLTSASYFLAFLFIATWVAANRRLGFAYLKFKLLAALYISAHFVALFIYQMHFVRPYLAHDSLEARFVDFNCL